MILFAKTLKGLITRHASLVIAGVLTTLVMLPSWPGFLSYDSLQMVREARTQVVGGIYPTAPVYLVRAFDLISIGNGPQFLFVAQVFLLLFSAATIFQKISKSWARTSFLTAALLAFPLVIGCMMVLWKDVTLAAIWLSAIAIIFSVSESPKSASRLTRALFNLVPLFLLGASLMRFNAVALCFPIFVYWHFVRSSTNSFAKFVGVTTAWLAIVVLASVGLTKYSIPDFRPLAPGNNLTATLGYDLLGMSEHSGKSLVPFDTHDLENPKMEIEDIHRIYSPLGVLVMQNRAADLGVALNVFPGDYVDADVYNAWFSAVFSDPISYLKYRSDIFGEIIGLTDHVTYEPTHFARIDPNADGFEFEDRPMTFAALGYVYAVSTTIFGKPWLPWLFATGLLSLALKRRGLTGRDSNRALALALYFASTLYLFPYFVLSATGEVRYAMPSTVGFIICIFVTLGYLRRVSPNDKIGSKSYPS